MSFILNALRKSEQERLARQSEAENNGILLPQPQQNRSKTTKFFVFLIFANVLTIVCIVWFIRNNLMAPPDTTAQTISKPLPPQETKLEPEAIAKSARPETPAQIEQSETTSIAEWIEEEKPEPAPLPAKPVITKKPAAAPVKQPVMAAKPAQPVQITPPVNVQPDAPETILVKQDTPFLNDLPFEFRQTLPKFTVNVFVYSQQAEERFVMIDMVKYKPGQQTKNAMVIKEILPDSLVVVYQNQTFKIKRP